ncbi:hypothetical protein [Xanthomonas albilineans]|nr:hypothetical protein [Xanthomonas albilineans]
MINIIVDSKHVWACIKLRGQQIAHGSTIAQHCRFAVYVCGDSICIGTHIVVQRGCMAPIVAWLRKHKVEVLIEDDSPHAPDLIDLQTGEFISEGSPT